MVYIADLKSVPLRRASSSLASGTICNSRPLGRLLYMKRLWRLRLELAQRVRRRPKIWRKFTFWILVEAKRSVLSPRAPREQSPFAVAFTWYRCKRRDSNSLEFGWVQHTRRIYSCEWANEGALAMSRLGHISNNKLFSVIRNRLFVNLYQFISKRNRVIFFINS